MSFLTSVQSLESISERVLYLLSEDSKRSVNRSQLDLDFSEVSPVPTLPKYSGGISDFLDLISHSVPDGDVYLFGGVLRDLALYGRKGFNSDLDLVVEGEWSAVKDYLEHLGAAKNKFGGYRLHVGGFPVDVWNAQDTWAIKMGYVSYEGIASLLESTVLNWDAVLMNWRTRKIVANRNYLQELHDRKLHVVLQENPNPIGMAVRVFRHLCMKDARKVTKGAANYLAICTHRYSFSELSDSEKQSYGNCEIRPSMYHMFKTFNQIAISQDEERWEVASELISQSDMLTVKNEGDSSSINL